MLARRGPIRRDDYVLTRLIELVVHGDDLARAMGAVLDHPGEPQAVAAVAEALATAYQTATGHRPDENGPLPWIRLAAGRMPSDDPACPCSDRPSAIEHSGRPLLTDRMGTLPSIETTRIPITTSYHGLDITEDYRWLEDSSSAETVAWTQAQRELTRAYFDSLPWRDGLRARVDRLLRAERTSYGSLASAGGTYFALKDQTPRQRPFLVALAGLDDTESERIVVDAEAIDPTGETTIDWFVPSPDGTRLAVSLSEHGTEDGTLHVFDVASGEVVDEPIPHVHLMGGSMAWRPDGGGFWFTRCADPAGFQQQVWFRDLGGGPDRLDVPERHRRRGHRGARAVRVRRRAVADGPRAEG